jgi:aquaporin Z
MCPASVRNEVVTAMLRALRTHWPEYLIEATLLGLFMISASLFTMLLEYPGSPAVAVLPDGFVRRMLIGIAMGLTALALILSPLGKRSGAHFNPAVTLTFLRLGKVQPWDAFFYVVAQFLGGIVGVAIVAAAVPWLLADPSVNFVATLPGMAGIGIAFAAEFAISFVLMLTVLNVSNHARLARYTPFFAATLVAGYITFEAPLSGMSMNPARTFGSAFVGHVWTGLWIYFTAPVLAMQVAALVYRRSGRVVYCAKLHHHNGARCIFNCAFSQLAELEAKRSPNADSAQCATKI